jgi:hypothetical protein
MTTLVIDREALPKSLSSIFSAPKLRFDVDAWGGSVAPVIDPDAMAAPTRAAIDELCDRLAIDTAGYVFDRNEANNYD